MIPERMKIYIEQLDFNYQVLEELSSIKVLQLYELYE